jgi:hypothetical protein
LRPRSAYIRPRRGGLRPISPSCQSFCVRLDSGTVTVGLATGPGVIFWASSWRNRISSGGEIKCATLCSQSRSSWQSQRSREPHAPTWSVPLLERVRALLLRVLSVRSRAGLLGVCLVGHIGDRQLAIAGSTTVSVAIARIIGITDAASRRRGPSMARCWL